MASLILAKMWLQDITLVDKDEVEDHNVASQFYKESQLWETKVSALAQNIFDFCWVQCKPYNERWTPENADQFEADIVVLAIDDMDIRREVVEYYKEDMSVLIVESRMWWEDYIIHTFYPFVMYYQWLWTWFPQAEADPVICTEKAICFNTALIAWEIGKIIKNHIMNITVPFVTSNMEQGDFTL